MAEVVINGIPHEVQNADEDAFPIPTRPPTKVTGILPGSAEVGGPDIELAVLGENFTTSTKIIFNGGEETTDYVNQERIHTTVKPSLASGPSTVPVGAVGASETFDFEFTEG